MLVYIKPLSIFPELHSDTIFGAICSAISELYPEKINEIVEEFEIEPPFLISSAFPYIEHDEKIIRFYPKVNTYNNSEKRYNASWYKEYKKIDYIDEDIFFDIISQKIDENSIIENYGSYNKVNNLLMKNDYEIDLKYNELIIPNNTINRLTYASENIFYTSGYQYKNLGLYFFIKILNKEYVPLIESAMRFLKDRGFGSDISTGKGQFDYEIDTNAEIEHKLDGFNGNYFVTLSRYIPNKKELSYINKNSTYEIVSKRGRSSSGEIRKQVKFFKEGSILNNKKDTKFKGKLVKSGIQNPAVEYGFAYPIYIKR